MELSKEASKKLIHALMNPDMDAIKKRDQFLKSINQTVILNKDGSKTVIFHDLDLNLGFEGPLKDDKL